MDFYLTAWLLVWCGSLMVSSAIIIPKNESAKSMRRRTTREPVFTLPHRACYFASWARYRPSPGTYLPSNVDPQLCTILLYAFGQITNNELNTYDWKDEDNFRELAAMKQTNPNFKVVLSVGGWTLKEQFPPMAGSAENRNIFVTSCVKKLRQWGVDGLDIDWEYPTASQKGDFSSLIRELRAAFDAESAQSGNVRLILGAAVGAVQTEGYDTAVMAKAFDLVNVMTYDFHGSGWEPTQTQHNSPLYPSSTDPLHYSISSAMNTWSANGMPKSKLNVGLAFYGRSWNLADPANHDLGSPANGPAPAGPITREAGILGYNEICTMVKSGQVQRVMDDQIKSPYAYGGNLWVGYDDEESIRLKAKWTITNGFAGAFVWEISNDDFTGTCGDTKILLQTLHDALTKTHKHPKNHTTTVPRRSTARPTEVPFLTSTTSTGQHATAERDICDWKFCTKMARVGSFALGHCKSDYCDCGGGFYAHTRQCPPGLFYDEMVGICNWKHAIRTCPPSLKYRTNSS